MVAIHLWVENDLVSSATHEWVNKKQNVILSVDQIIELTF